VRVELKVAEEAAEPEAEVAGEVGVEAAAVAGNNQVFRKP
jgi:hypothetical protein